MKKEEEPMKEPNREKRKAAADAQAKIREPAEDDAI